MKMSIKKYITIAEGTVNIVSEYNRLFEVNKQYKVKINASDN